MDIKNWIICWFVDNTDLARKEVEKGCLNNYFEEGWIDSFGFISFMGDMEKEYGIYFSNNEFQDRGFATIEGLTDIVKKKIDEK